MNDKSVSTVTIGCRLPKGILLEVGLQTTAKVTGPSGVTGLVAQVKKTDRYQRQMIKGTHHHNAALFRQGIRPPSVLAPEPFYNFNIPKDFWDEWVRTHPDSWLLKSRNLFKLEGDARAATIDAMARKAPLAPLDPSKPLTVGNDKVETADFKDEK